MTSYIQFAPSSTSNFQFQCQLDGSAYNVVVTWSLFGARYYVNVYSLDGTLIVVMPMIGSPPALNLASVTYANGKAIATTATPHTFAVGSVVNLTISGVSPSDYNGSFQCAVLSNTQFSYPIATMPADSTSSGTVAYNINLAAGYFKTSSIVWRVDSGNFEVSP
ncbi:hypothetical protein WM24_23875 [Burkholderia ubonensis]|uniref:hypothetical protein n=1 Tax=Burkholderia ubonensis TaxID=101571 RepID=UPI0007559FCA|nr:hypothetical protein [Burkholderia ubonensis]KWN80876.1 hypothetical protein WM24_23875 [Burkholderia ubonensis]